MSPLTVHSKTLELSLEGKSTEIAFHTISSATESILLLHEALGSVSYWKDFPQKLARATGANVLLYSRPGHGNSQGPLEERDDAHYLRQIQAVIPALLSHFSIDNPIVYGHSEGAGIAILYAAIARRVKALILESPYVLPERATYLHIQKMAAAYPGSKLQQKLARYHRQPDDVFYSWVSWASTLDNDSFPLRDYLSSIHCPVLVLQGAKDDFGTTEQLRTLQASIPHLEHETFPETGHLPHREVTDPLLNRVARFLAGTHRLANNLDRSPQTSLLEEQR